MWRAITEDDVYGQMNDPEATALRAALLRPGQEDPLPVNIRHVTGYVRDAIRSNDGNALHPDATFLPDGVIPFACDLIVYRLAKRLGRALKLTDEVKEAKDDAEKYFDKVAKGDREIESYGTDEAATPTGGAVEQITPTRRRADRDGLKGL